MILTLLVLICLNFAYGEVDVNEIRAEEEKLHNATLVRYLTAVSEGKLNSVFPSPTAGEIAEAEVILADVISFADPLVSEEKFELICRARTERAPKILAYVRKRWPLNLVTQVTARVGILSYVERLDKYCSDPALRSALIQHSVALNPFVSVFNATRSKFIDNALAIVYGNRSLHTLNAVCCLVSELESRVLAQITDSEPRSFLKANVDAFNGKLLNYLCGHHSESACANVVIPPPPTNVPRFASVAAAFFELLNSIKSLN